MNLYYEANDCHSVEDFLSLTRSLGEIINHPNGEQYDIVSANNGSSARKGSFSHNFGFNFFPLHTDTAFWDIPARLMVMWSPKVSATSTTLMPWHKIIDSIPNGKREIINDAIFTLYTYEYVKYCSLKLLTSGITGFRYDPNIMNPANKQAEEFVFYYNLFIQETDLDEFKWSGSNALIVDNWNVLHGRKIVENTKENRRIYRAYVR